MSRLLSSLSLLAVTLSVLLLALLLLKIPDAIVPHPEDYRAELIQRMEGESDTLVLKQMCRLKFTYLLSSNEVCSWLLYSSLAVTSLNSAVLLLTVLRRRSGETVP